MICPRLALISRKIISVIPEICGQKQLDKQILITISFLSECSQKQTSHLLNLCKLQKNKL